MPQSSHCEAGAEDSSQCLAQSGKGSCLRELALCTRDHEYIAVLLLRGSGPGLFQSLANLVTIELEWNLTASDAHQWLWRMHLTRSEAATRQGRPPYAKF